MLAHSLYDIMLLLSLGILAFLPLLNFHNIDLSSKWAAIVNIEEMKEGCSGVSSLGYTIYSQFYSFIMKLQTSG